MGPARFRCATLLQFPLCYDYMVKLSRIRDGAPTSTNTLSFGILGSIVVSIPACHAGDRGSIPRRGGLILRTCSFS